VVYMMGSVEDADTSVSSAGAVGTALPAAVGTAGAAGGGTAVVAGIPGGTVTSGAPVGSVVSVPTLVQGLLGLPIQQICCGGQHAAVLTKFGTVLTWGRGGFGRLGHGHTEKVGQPTEVCGLLSREVCVQVACGFAYTAAVTLEGRLFTWGAGENGRLGLGDVEDRHSPARVVGLSDHPVHEVFAGSVHTCVLTRSGDVFSFGKFEYTGHGELGGDDVLLPRRLDAFGTSTVTQISVGPGGYHTIALTSDRQVFTWGHNRVGQLGYSNSDVVPRNGEGAHFLPTPKAVAAMAGLNVRHVVAGWGHSAALTASGAVLICGRNFRGQLGLGDPAAFPVNERDHPFQAHFVPVGSLGGKQVVQVACGGEHSAALTSDGEVFTFGNGSKGQLGHGALLADAHLPRLVSQLRATRRAVAQVTCGNNCTLVLAGGFSPPTLLVRCMEVVRGDAALMAHLDDLGLPTDIAAAIRATPDLTA
jgi:alpha-tubulin suppressor-like RCC1 family protein